MLSHKECKIVYSEELFSKFCDLMHVEKWKFPQKIKKKQF